MNTADFRGIDTVREIVRNMAIAPMSGSCRVWILDECHNLTKDAQHALLKALEDMPNHVYFLLATTDPGKLLDTIRTRCVTFEVKPLSDDEMKTLVAGIVEKEVVKVPTEVVDQIVFDSQGSARMALTILDKIIGMEPEEMLEAAKQQAADQNEAIALCRALLRKRPWGEVSLILRGIEQEPEQVRRMVLGYAQSVLLKEKDNGQAYIILAAFREPLYDSGKPGLVAACYEAVH
uniref:Putative DNA polymerase n=1 Tax=viral metagenome TaxID=1070528 RepID=A0A6M3IPZ3_9ZZZZ